MRAGRLRHRVNILRKITQVDTEGSHTDAWQKIGRVWAGVEFLRGREYFNAGMSRGEVDVRVVMRAGPEVRVADRIEFKKRLLDVQTVPIDMQGRGRQVELMCKEYVA